MDSDSTAGLVNKGAQSSCRDTKTTSNPTATGNRIASMDNNTANSAVSKQEAFETGEEGDLSRLEKEEEEETAGVHPMSSDESQATNHDAHDRGSTPPTSTSDGFSSQSTGQDIQLSQLSQLSQLAAVQMPLEVLTRPALTVAPTAGFKRTADGELKSPISPRVRGHSRNTSAVSNASSSSRIGELSSELRTRLSYAMVKVNHGWQSHTIEEVESLASQKGSPTSSNSTMHGRRKLITSPRATIASIQGQTSNISAITQTSSGDFDLYSRTEPASMTYESFWADHPSANVPHQRVTSPPTKPLAPSAEIRPTPFSRRSGTPKFAKPPTMPGHSSNPSLLTGSPRTPNRIDYGDRPIQSQSQKTLQEQDAMEALLFMSSPGNSGNMGHAFPPPRTVDTPQRSPLRAEFQARPHGKRVGFYEAEVAATASTTSSDIEYRRRPERRPRKTRRGQTDAMDRMLDEMVSSSDEEGPVLTYDSPRRIAAGRV